MPATIKMTIPAAAVLLLSACGGGGGGSTASAVPGTNGLDFGFAGQSLSQAETVEVTATAAEFEAAGVLDIVPQSVTLGSGFFSAVDDTDLNGSIVVLGETVDIVGGVGTLSDGEEVRISADAGDNGTYAARINASFIPVSGSLQGENYFVIGFETNPEEIEALTLTTGDVTYTGGFSASGTLGGSQSGQTEYEGTATFIANYTDETVSTQLDGTVAVGAQDAVALLAADSTSIDVSGFDGTLFCISGCSGTAGELDGTFYGPDAAEVGGVFTVDVEPLDGVTFTGAGSFIAAR